MTVTHLDLTEYQPRERLARMAQEQIRAARVVLYQISLHQPELIDLVEMSDGQRVEALIRGNCLREARPAAMGKYERWEGRFI